MPRYAIVVHDLKKHREYHAKSGARSVHNFDVGHVHTEMDDECPLGLPNCRNCGDPAYAERCKEAGHCPDCGTKHGIAPESVLEKHGFKLEPK